MRRAEVRAKGEDKWAYAGDSEFASFFHYEPFKAEYLTDILKNQRIHCSDPNNFNDPWDCKPWFDISDLSDPDKHRNAADWFIENQLEGPKGDSDDQRLRTDPALLRDLISSFSQNFVQHIRSRWALYCLTPHPDSILMWSHYAENHKGICLEFRNDNPTIQSAKQVIYRSKYPVWLINESKEKSLELLLTKSEVWSYEKEYRLICPIWNRLKIEHPLIVRDGYLALPTGALKSIIVGANGSHDAVAEIVKQYAPEMPIRRARRSANQFALSVTPP